MRIEEINIKAPGLDEHGLLEKPFLSVDVSAKLAQTHGHSIALLSLMILSEQDRVEGMVMSKEQLLKDCFH